MIQFYHRKKDFFFIFFGSPKTVVPIAVCSLSQKIEITLRLTMVSLACDDRNVCGLIYRGWQRKNARSANFSVDTEQQSSKLLFQFSESQKNFISLMKGSILYLISILPKRTASNEICLIARDIKVASCPVLRGTRAVQIYVGRSYRHIRVHRFVPRGIKSRFFIPHKLF